MDYVDVFHKLKFSPTQYAFFFDTTKISCMSGGYKSGKSFVGIHKFGKLLTETRQTGIIASATYDLVNLTLLPVFEKFLRDGGYEYSFSPSKKMFTIQIYDDLKKQCIPVKVYLRTLDKPSSFEGLNIGLAYLDEVDLLKIEKIERVYNTVLSKLTMGDNPYIIMTGTNEGYHFIYEKFYLDSTKVAANVYEKPDMKLFICSTLENAERLGKDYIRTLFRQYDAKNVARYIHGEFVNLNNDRAYYAFDEQNYTNEVYNPKSNLYLCFDFNVNPMVCLLVQPIKPAENYQRFACVKEFVQRDSNTRAVCESVKEFLLDTKFDKYEGNLEVTGDYSGIGRATSSDMTDWEIIRRYFKNFKGFRQNISMTRNIRHRLNCANAFFKNYENEKRMFVNPKICKETTKDLLTVHLKDNGEIDHSGGKSHCSDALSEFAKNYFPIKQEMTYYHV